MINRILVELNQDPHYPVNALLTAYHLTSVYVEAKFLQTWCYHADWFFNIQKVQHITAVLYSDDTIIFSLVTHVFFPFFCILSLKEGSFRQKNIEKYKSQEAHGCFKMIYSWSLGEGV